MAQTAVKAEVSGTVWTVELQPGASVAEGNVLTVLESMKMEIPVTAPVAGKLSRLDVDAPGGCVCILDIDFFKAINDSYGHSAGDDVLKEFSRRLKKAVRGIDLACRFGGEEFVVVMPDTSIAMATMVAERLRKRIAAEPFRINQNTRTVQATISVGIAAMRSVEDRPGDIIRRADEALYRAKRQGRNRVVADAA